MENLADELQRLVVGEEASRQLAYHQVKKADRLAEKANRILAGMGNGCSFAQAKGGYLVTIVSDELKSEVRIFSRTDENRWVLLASRAYYKGGEMVEARAREMLCG